jgi:HD-GYP domain-containing protein (c-di-GMP phosphodiesterase class II)
MRFATRTFLCSFVPVAALLTFSFWVVRTVALAAVREGLRAAAREHQTALARLQTRSEDRERRILRGIAENPALKAGLRLLEDERAVPDEARNTVQDQLTELSDTLHFDLMMVSSAQGVPLVAVTREATGFTPLKFAPAHPPEQGIVVAGGRLYEVNSVPIYEEAAEVATLFVGALFDVSRFGVPAVLLDNGSVVASQIEKLVPAQAEAALQACSLTAECELRLQGQTYLSLPLTLGTVQAGSRYILRSLQSIDAASRGVEAVLRRLFLVAGLAALAATLGISVLSSRSIAQPLTELAMRLRESTSSGDLPDFPERGAGAQEILELTRGFNQAAKAVREGREHLTRAYVEFVGSLAQALDARDSYTAGHSRRVSEYACAISQAMGLPEQEIETIRVGALLHDLGKIGISDLVLQKPGRLTADENELIQRHPVIGRRILENVHGLEPYLAIVELHHENWDGTGYPHGLKGVETPLQARIVKVADAYDAMTSDRPYRRGMSHEQALAILTKVSGSETDVAVVEAFARLWDLDSSLFPDARRSLRQLAEAVRNETIDVPVPEETV